MFQKKCIKNAVLFGVGVGVIGVFAYMFFSKTNFFLQKSETVAPNSLSDTVGGVDSGIKQDDSASSEYTIYPVLECVQCVDGNTWDNKPCCSDSFEEECFSKGGVIRTRDLHPDFTLLKGCFQKAPDTGKECALSTDCLSESCNLEDAIKEGRCVFSKKRMMGDQKDQEFYTATYDCSTTHPGVCEEARSNSVNPGGKLRTFEMEGKTLIETVAQGLIF